MKSQFSLLPKTIQSEEKKPETHPDKVFPIRKRSAPDFNWSIDCVFDMMDEGYRLIEIQPGFNEYSMVAKFVYIEKRSQDG